MIVLVPVSMFSINFNVARGRPYSRLERRVLEEVAARAGVAPHQGATLTSLCHTFQVHERLMVEAVVTLVGAGWVAVTSGREAAFVLTDEGQQACSLGKDPASVVVVSASPCTVVFDRTAGQLARRGEVHTVSKQEARPDLNPCTPVRILRNTLDESQIQKLLPHASGEWVRDIGRPRLVTFRRYLPVRVDLADRSVTGLPRGWHQALSAETLAVAQTRQEEIETDLQSALRTPARKETSLVTAPRNATGEANRPTPLSVVGRKSPAAAVRELPRTGDSFPWLDEAESLTNESNGFAGQSIEAALFSEMSGEESHRLLIARALATAANHVLIASPTVDVESLSKLSDAIQAAVARGVRVDILYGETEKGTTSQDVVDLLHRIGYHAAQRLGRDLLRPAKEPTGSGASLLIFDQRDGALQAVIGDYAWVGAPSSRQARSAHLGGTEFMAQVARAAAGLWMWTGDPDSADRWRRVADRCQDDAAVSAARGDRLSYQVLAELIVDDEHAQVPASPESATLRIGGAHRHENGSAVGIRGISAVIRRPDTLATP
ncbi:phospholipase D-like domain-containing protein [Actinacidiphila rubida]|uniref:Uncharacterized protein n=1 Tax=Actinacidiphila rubida TaxID=310780 RepID=A0A1H8TV42_9ACTN|nr:hypothetical protein [Actinacidiphila rubida]SEO94494.1 hypothetical protein SAMN05216267_10592 [Actinacidiphila rubida]